MHKVVWLGKYFAEKSFPFPENENFRNEVSFLAVCLIEISYYCSAMPLAVVIVPL